MQPPDIPRVSIQEANEFVSHPGRKKSVRQGAGNNGDIGREQCSLCAIERPICHAPRIEAYVRLLGIELNGVRRDRIGA